MKKLKITTNRGSVFDFFLNAYLNIGLWFSGIQDDEERACDFAAKRIGELKYYFNI